ncbi:MAG: histidine-type phosphatase [Bacteroidales bacterium]|nr:histidine-type phosphatase [Bacteroidales bacterium]
MRRLSIVVILLCSALFTAGAQDFSKYPNPEFAKMISEKPWIANLNACPYEMAVQPGPQTKAPHGYKPFYISHYGRHGSRSGWDQDKYKNIISTLGAAKEAGILTASGDSLLNEVTLVKEATNKMDGRLTVRGQREHRAIANRMYKNFRRVFRRGSKNVRVLSSTVPRCLVSMAAFTNQLSELDYRLSIVMDCGEEIQKEISNDSAPEDRAARHHITDSLRHSMPVDYSGMMSLLFTDTTTAKQFVPVPRYLARDIFGVGRICRSFDFDFNMFRFLPFDAVYYWAEYNNVSMYLGQCNSVPFGDNRMARTKPLVDLVVRQADEAVATGDVAADLRFGHDYPLMALCSYLGVVGAAERYDVEGARQHYISTLVAPFAGNLQIVFYRSRKADKPVLVKLLLNENEVRLMDLEPVQGPYYSWEALREKISR